MPQAASEAESLVCSVEIIDPLSQPGEYGNDRLLSQITDLARLYESNSGSDAVSILAAASLSRTTAIRWFKDREHMYDVLDDGTGIVRVPFLCCSAPTVDTVSVTAKRSDASAKSRGVALKVLGTGLSADAKLTITKSIELTCETGERRAVYVDLPVNWAVRALGNHHKYRWLFVEPQRVIRELPVRVEEVTDEEWERWGAVGYPEDVSTVGGGKAALKVDRSYTIDSTAGFEIGFTAGGIDVNLTVESQRTTSIELSTSLPRGNTYRIRWLGRPPGVDLTTL